MLERLEAEREDGFTVVAFDEFMARGPDVRRPVRPLTAEEAALVDRAMLVRRQRRLADLDEVCQALRHSGKPWGWRRAMWYTVFKPHLHALVGWDVESNDPVLRSSRAWDVAYEHCYNALTGEGDD